MKQISITEIKNLINLALKEDIGTGDITSQLTISPDKNTKFELISKEEFILCGQDFFNLSFATINKDIAIKWHYQEGDLVPNKQIIASGSGNALDILKSERVALNFLQYLSAIATETNKYVKIVQPYNCQILDTRKTLPLYRNAAKYAVTIGGGKNHRFRLDDQILIKDNHIAASGGITQALQKCQNSTLKKEIECETIAQVKTALEANADIIMLDNMDINTMKKAVSLIAKKCKTEASGNVSLDNILAIAQTGVDYISIGKITHSVSAIDISLKII